MVARYATLVAALAFLLPVRSAAYLQRYIITSLPKTGHVQYIKVKPDPHALGESKRLITDGLIEPIGLAVDDRIPRLYVADPASKAVYGYNLVEQGGELMTNGLQMIVCGNVDVRWLAVNTHGDLYMTEGVNNLVLHVPGEELRKTVIATSLIPKQLFNGAGQPEVSTPHGIATDGNHVFWGNGADGTSKGTVVRGKVLAEVIGKRLESKKTKARKVMRLAQNLDSASSVCVSLTNGFFISKSPPAVFGFKKDMDSSNVVRVANMIDPQSCAWDKDGTIYVTDRVSSKIFKFPANMPSLHIVDPQVIAEQTGVTGVAVFVGSPESEVNPQMLRVAESGATTVHALLPSVAGVLLMGLF